MDPVTAFGIVTGVFQVLEFGRAATKTCLDIHKQGASSENLDLESSTRQLIYATKRLGNTLHGATAGKYVPNDDDTRVQALAKECNDTAEDLLDLLEQLKPRSSARSRRLETFKKGVSTLWQKDEIKRLERRLEKLKSVVDTEILNRLT